MIKLLLIACLVLITFVIVECEPSSLCSEFERGTVIMAYNSTGNQIAFMECDSTSSCLIFLCDTMRVGGVYFTIELISGNYTKIIDQ